MDKNEREILDKIKEKVSDVEIPKEITPEEISKKLEQKNKRNTGSITKILAAVFVLVLISGVVVSGVLRQVSKKNEGTDTQKESGVTEADTYSEIADYLEKYYEGIKAEPFLGDGMIMGKSEEATGTAEPAAEDIQITGADSSYSDTNQRHGDVGEGDIVKTDGEYLYIRRSNQNQVEIVQADQGTLKKISTIQMEEEDLKISELYLCEDKLIITGTIGEMWVWGGYAKDTESETKETQAVVMTYSVADRNKPELIGEYTQSGYLQSSRFVDGYMYLFSEYMVPYEFNRDQIDTFIPKANGDFIKEADIYMPGVKQANQYLVVSSIDMEHPDESIETKAVLSEYGQLYVSGNSIFVYSQTWKDEQNQTEIRKMSYKDGRIKGSGKATIEGYINDSFSLDEYEDHLRLVITNNEDNALYILDKEMKITGKITGLAKGEQIYSARFMGDIGYFVTFRQVDPLFSVDLSNPENPKVLGALKIPGFSEYLHPYGENLLLGIGLDMSEDGMSNGVKLSMFDTTDKEDVKEEDKIILEGIFYSDVSYDYKAALVDVERNLIGFGVDGGNKYVLYRYSKEEGFTKLLEEELIGGYDASRGIYIDDYLYLIKGDAIKSYSLEDYKEAGQLIL